MSVLMIYMKSGDKFSIKSKSQRIVDTIKEFLSKENNWSICELANKDSDGNNNVAINCNEIESIKYLGASNGQDI